MPQVLFSSVLMLMFSIHLIRLMSDAAKSYTLDLYIGPICWWHPVLSLLSSWFRGQLKHWIIVGSWKSGGANKLKLNPDLILLILVRFSWSGNLQVFDYQSALNRVALRLKELLYFKVAAVAREPLLSYGWSTSCKHTGVTHTWPQWPMPLWHLDYCNTVWGCLGRRSRNCN